MANNIPTANCHFLNYLKNSSLNSMFIPPATENEITDIISNLKITKSCDLFELIINIIKRNAHNICKPLTHLVNQSFLTSIVPKSMKIANISPILKSGDGHDMTNYWPISKLSFFSKILERAMHNRFSDFMESNAILYNKQFGFRKNHSITHAVPF